MAGQHARRRWTSFSLRAFLLGIASVAVLLAIESNRASKQRRAVSALQQLHVQVSYDYEHAPTDYGRRRSDISHPVPDWLRRTVGDDFLTRVVRLNFEGRRINDSDLSWLASLPDVRWLSLFDTPVSDDGMNHLKSLSKLQTLYFFDTGIGDDGLQHISHLKQLREIQCGRTLITDEGLRYLKRLPRLEELSIGGTSVSDQGIEDLSRLTSLKFLDLRRTNVSEKAVEELAQSLPGCRILH